MPNQPPNSPWIPLKTEPRRGGYLSYHYSDDLSELAVRWVTKPGDNESDPNLETGTYGLFSTCSPRMRSGAVKNHIGTIFFCTRKDYTRVLSGFYQLGWYTKGPLGDGD